jgi:hypothetical protein
MSNPVLPTVIRGPAIVIQNGYSFYTQADINVKVNRPTWEPRTDAFGSLGPRASGLPIWEVSLIPAGELESLVKYYPYGPSNLVGTSPIGTSIYTGTLIIHTKAGQTITFERAGMSKMPMLQLGPRVTPFGGMTFKAMGQLAVQPSNVSWVKLIATTAFTDVSFDASKIISDIYSAALGARVAPFNALGARAHFEFEPTLELDVVDDANLGEADTLIASVGCKVRFAPNNLTEAQVDELANWQGANVILPGQSIGRDAEDLVIGATALTATLHRAGVMTAEHGYGVKVDRNGNIEFQATHSSAAGVLTPLFGIVLN